ncbi:MULTISPECIES: EAL domain-containing protein [unclassified Bradyrhizobium]|uniref:EAL domain-containing protein n=1 Tax=unclassified Bradyrhizobium TaxID=2631580 RepID=UPI00211EB14A|nr:MULTISPECIES: EAL domain-containing protein [unclassified Bradyrhizobium]MDD1535227.1 diguanylate phosphodiesterase [Bradyrhizobium sp. WBOS8]MDD1584895.1 diguanylate phosphodiesterase [Bradyrhizobium sp. WBOS4]UUO50320.1 diguanylate phosphodiesterase [Bradyrhizobium sp. WBOS04]UUO59086.1 diguanylate phosphodiesterase [Bradyrhizobium sp. WBOS08]
MGVTCAGCADGTELPFEFKMAFQPIVDVAENRIWGYEALVRGPSGESAHSVLSQLTDQQIYRFDQAARVMAIETAGRLFVDPRARLSINFMPNAVYEPRACIRKSLEAARRVNFPASNLMFEFTENERMSDPAHVENIVRTYKALGFWTALDDFGAGYAGLGLLARLQPNLIKIDMELLRDIHLSRPKQVIVSGLAQIARELDITVLAEGVENEAELITLRAAGIALFQGYYFARPALMSLPAVRGFERIDVSLAG